MFDRVKSWLDEVLKYESTTTTTLGLHHQNVERGAGVQVAAPQVATEKNEPHHIDLTNGGVTFSVDDVVPASDPLWQGSMAESTEIRVDGNVLVMPDGQAPALAPEGYVGVFDS